MIYSKGRLQVLALAPICCHLALGAEPANLRTLRGRVRIGSFIDGRWCAERCSSIRPKRPFPCWASRSCRSPPAGGTVSTAIAIVLGQPADAFARRSELAGPAGRANHPFGRGQRVRDGRACGVPARPALPALLSGRRPTPLG